MFLVLLKGEQLRKMYNIKIHKLVGLVISLFYRIGIWHRGDMPTVRERRVKCCYCFHYAIYLLSFVVGAINNENMDKSIFLTEAAMGVGVYSVKLWILIWKQNEIVDLLNRICEFRDDCGYALCKDKLRGFTTLAIVFVMSFLIGAILTCSVLPLFANDKTLFFEIAFPLDYRNNEIAFWIASIFILTEMMLTITVALFSIVIWYLLLNCSLRYEVLGWKNLGTVTKNIKISQQQMQIKFVQDLKESIDAHIHLREYATGLNYGIVTGLKNLIY